MKTLTTLTLATITISPALAQNSSQPNVLLIMCDDLMAYDGIYKDYPKAQTPNLDKLRDKGVNFVNAHTTAPVSAPSRAAMFTGIYPHVSKNYGFTPWYKNPVLSSSETLFAHMKKEGYDVYGTGKLMHHLRKDEYTRFGKNNYAGPLAYDGKKAALHPSVPKPYAEVGPLDGTFCSIAEIPDVKPTKNAPGYKGWYDLQRNKPFKYIDDNNRSLFRDEEHAIWVKNLLKELEAKGENQKPFFIGMGLSKPHTALVAPQKYFDMYPVNEINMPKMQNEKNKNLGFLKENTPYSKGYKHYEAMKKAYPDSLEYGLRKYMQAYMACVTFADDIIGSVLDELEKSPFADNTVVIFVSDHGYDFGQKNYLFKNSLWETSTSIPFYVYCPGKEYQHGIKVNHPISLIDIYPTINDICGLSDNTIKDDKGAKLSGYSIVPFLKEGDATKDWKGPEVALTLVGNPDNKDVKKQNYSIKSKEWRYILYSNGKEELYHSVNDPYEWNNLAYNKKYKDIKKKMYSSLCKLVPEIQ